MKKLPLWIGHRISMSFKTDVIVSEQCRNEGLCNGDVALDAYLENNEVYAMPSAVILWRRGGLSFKHQRSLHTAVDYGSLEHIRVSTFVCYIHHPTLSLTPLWRILSMRNFHHDNRDNNVSARWLVQTMRYI